jgi:hypothetical protein
MVQHMSRVGAYLETCTDLAQLGRLLEDRDIVPCRQKVRRRCQSTDAGSGNEDFMLRHLTLLALIILLANPFIQGCIVVNGNTRTRLT